MLDAETKRRIDTARDILVGKVPDPKSQVEQITIALIYKFMDDLDSESEELGGERQFFADGFARYGWSKLMHPGMGGHETLNLYAEAITRMPENPGIPPLFRDIFNNAYLPYRDPETLRAFLKIINEFSYDHSERLGDAFEYLLSVLGSQGDAGQFRTPRHIIDFIVAVVDPKKDEVVLDPACGTAGFLISSYKHILAANTDPGGNSTLTPDERGRFADNFKGYDISPDMVRLSLVNMYLHGFVAPQISEYDTLTSDERWNEYADVILANPPFMSPKGGIRPHNRFSVKSKRSEVLFVDYMAEHLTPTGRAGIIVPEGIIFQSQKAHTALRKMLVEEYLVAVVSLPAGVFNPYSGVKTSILILDKALARRTDRIAFFKVDADGYHLGAQRRPVDRNDLPQAQAELTEYLARLRAGASLDDFAPNIGLIVEKDRVAADGDYNLSGERYLVTETSPLTWPVVSIGQVFERISETVLPSSLNPPVTYVGLENISQNTGRLIGQTETCDPTSIKSLKTVFSPNQILYGKLRPNLNKVWFSDRSGICSTDIFAIKAKLRQTEPALYSHIFRSQRFNKLVINQLTGAQLPRIGWQSFAKIQIPLPSLKVQQEIVAEIEGYQRVIDGARAVVENYRPHIAVDPEWPVVRIDTLCELGRGRVISKRDIGANPGPYPVYSSQTTDNGVFGYLGSYAFDGEYVTWTTDGANAGTVFHRKGRFNCTNVCGTLKVKENTARQTNMKYLAQILGQMTKPYVVQVGNPKLMNKEVARIRIPLPSLAVQQALVAELEAELALVKANRELVERMEKKIQAAIGRVWGEDATLTNHTRMVGLEAESLENPAC